MTSTRRSGVMTFTLSSFHDMARLPTYHIWFGFCDVQLQPRGSSLLSESMMHMCNCLLVSDYWKCDNYRQLFCSIVPTKHGDVILKDTKPLHLHRIIECLVDSLRSNSHMEQAQYELINVYPHTHAASTSSFMYGLSNLVGVQHVLLGLYLTYKYKL